MKPKSTMLAYILTGPVTKSGCPGIAFWRLRLGILHVLQVGKITGEQMERLIGHVTWAMMLRRESLAILGSVYAFIRVAWENPTPLWSAVDAKFDKFVRSCRFSCPISASPGVLPSLRQTRLTMALE